MRIRFTKLTDLVILSTVILISCESTSTAPKQMHKKSLDKTTSSKNVQKLSPELLKATQARLDKNLHILARDIGERNYQEYTNLKKSVTFLEKELKSYGYQPARQTYKVKGQAFHNLEVEIKGHSKPNEIVIIGAHYDSVVGTPGADDNGTGTIGTLELARHFAKSKPSKTLRFVFFVNEEPPFFQTEDMGSLVYARRCSARKENIVAMLSLEMIGYFSDAKDSQAYPMGLGLIYPSTGNFIGFVGNPSSSKLNKKSQKSFEKTTDLPTQRLSAPSVVTGVGFSDHWSFWQVGYSAIMVTDTAFMRNHHYHETTDTPDTIDYPRFTKVVLGLVGVVNALVK